MRICHVCGEVLAWDALFCNQCGAKQDPKSAPVWTPTRNGPRVRTAVPIKYHRPGETRHGYRYDGWWDRLSRKQQALFVWSPLLLAAIIGVIVRLVSAIIRALGG